MSDKDPVLGDDESPVRLLPLEFQLRGFVYTQLRRDGEVAIFEQKRDGKVTAYEVAVIRFKAAATIMGNSVPAREAYPSSETWGKLGWTCRNLEAAEDRFARVLARRNELRELLEAEPADESEPEEEEEAV